MPKIALVVLVVLSIVAASIWFMLSARFSSAHIIDDCKSVANTSLCYADRIDDMLVHRGLSAAFDLLAVIYDADPDFAATCHAQTHELGKAAYAQFHRTGEVELSRRDSYCGYGFYHGFMEALVTETNDLDEARVFCTYAGKVVPEPHGYAEGACYHGIGHGVSDGYDPKLWGDAEALAAPGLALCRRVVPTGGELGRRCASGVFNSIAILYRNPKYKLTTDNPFALCGKPFSAIEKESCYDQMNTLAVFMAKGDLSKAVAYSNDIARPEYRSIAVKAITGFYIQTLKSAREEVSPTETSIVCGPLAPALREACVRGLIDGMMEFGKPGAQDREILALCAAPELSSDVRSTCFQRLLFHSELRFTKEKAQAICREILEQYRGLPSVC